VELSHSRGDPEVFIREIAATEPIMRKHQGGTHAKNSADRFVFVAGFVGNVNVNCTSLTSSLLHVGASLFFLPIDIE
jgi:hypothetical protein